MNDIQLTEGYIPGVIGRITELHGTYYSAVWNLGLHIEAGVASDMGDFFRHFDPCHDGAWVARTSSQIVGGVFILGSEAEREGARLRWFIVDPAYQGRGVGRRLIEAAVSFCDLRGYPRVYLTTFAGLDSARHLYEQYGFRVCGEMDATELTGDPSKVELVMERVAPA